jgi:hypothetical protein
MSNSYKYFSESLSALNLDSNTFDNINISANILNVGSIVDNGSRGSVTVNGDTNILKTLFVGQGINANSQIISNVTSPNTLLDVANKYYVDNSFDKFTIGINQGQIIIASTGGNITGYNNLTFNTSGMLSILTTTNSVSLTNGGALTVLGGASFNGDIYSNNLYSNGVLLKNNLFGTEYNYNEILPTSGTTSTTFQQRVSLTTSSLLGGNYKINMGYVFDKSSANKKDGIFQVLLDPTGPSTGEIIHEYVDRNNRTRFVLPQYSSITKNLTPGVHFVSLIWRSASNGSVIFISNARLELFRVN